MDWGGNDLDQKGPSHKKHYFKYTVQGPSEKDENYLEGDQISNLDLYSKIKSSGDLEISVQGKTPQVILFTMVGEVEKSLANNKNLIVDAKKAVVQHPIYLDNSQKYHLSELKPSKKVCLVNEKLCVNKAELTKLNLTPKKISSESQHLIITNDKTPAFKFITDEKGRYWIGKGSCASLNDQQKNAQRGINEFELNLTESKMYEGCYLSFEDQSRNLTEIALTPFKVDFEKPEIINHTWKRGLQTGNRDSDDDNSVYYNDSDNISLYLEFSDNDGNYIKKGLFKKCGHKTEEVINSSSGNDTIEFLNISDNGSDDGWYGECEFVVIDNASNESDPIVLPGFVLDTQNPEVEVVNTDSEGNVLGIYE